MHNVSIMRLQSHDKMPPPTSTANIQFCPGCKLAMYCSKEHRKYLWQDGHRRVCGTPPFRVPGVDEELVCREVFGEEPESPGATTAMEFDDDNGGDFGPPNGGGGEMERVGDAADDDDDEAFEEAEDDDDSGDWESINSEEEFEPAEERTRTEIIHRYFDTKAYKVQDRQPPAFGAAPVGH
uniref:MYND-type domain-containing protein n=1 Tax=Trieres chinensis TaxID=1514140 RepID=A0A7S2EQL2_TRICV